MKPCVCGHFHTIGCPHCGCSYYEEDTGDGRDYRIDFLWDRSSGGNSYLYEASQAKGMVAL